jgi:hypothetical protein
MHSNFCFRLNQLFIVKRRDSLRNSTQISMDLKVPLAVQPADLAAAEGKRNNKQ